MFVVYLTYYKGKELPHWYIGSSYEEKVINGYNGSVKSKKYGKTYNREQKENKHLFKTRILSYHQTREESLEEELRIQRMHKVMTNNNYFNESYACKNGCFGRDVSGKNNPNYGNQWSEDQKKSLSEYKKSLNLVPHNITYFNIFNEHNELVHKNVSGAFCRKIHKNLPNKTVDNRIKKSSGLTRHNKLHLIGWYSEKI